VVYFYNISKNSEALYRVSDQSITQNKQFNSSQRLMAGAKCALLAGECQLQVFNAVTSPKVIQLFSSLVFSGDVDAGSYFFVECGAHSGAWQVFHLESYQIKHDNNQQVLQHSTELLAGQLLITSEYAKYTPVTVQALPHGFTVNRGDDFRVSRDFSPLMASVVNVGTLSLL